MTETRQHYGKEYIVLSKNISAIQVLFDEIGRRRMGTLIQLPEGAALEVCGEGFDPKTVKVSWEGAVYYVFLAELNLTEVQRERSYTFAATV